MNGQYGLVFDLKKCLGCHTCVIACKAENHLKRGSQWIKVVTVGGGAMDVPGGTYPRLSMYWQPLTCMHCKHPACVDTCPDHAIHKREDGIVVIDRQRCSGCELCIPACPYQAISFDNIEKVAQKCHLCVHRIADGLQPFCVKECVWGAIHFGDMSDPESDVSKIVKSSGGYVMYPEKGLEPAVFYLPPKGWRYTKI